MPASVVEFEPIAQALSRERLRPYVEASDGDLRFALRLYEWNLRASGAFYEALSIVEVVLRNVLAEELTKYHEEVDGHWYEDPQGVLVDRARADISEARRRVRNLDREETPGRIVAELNLGFWKFLLAKRYESVLWTPSLRHAFPNLRPQRRETVYSDLDNVHKLRNRIAHHEPIHGRDLAADAGRIDRILDWIDPEVARWSTQLSRLDDTLAARPKRE